MAILNAFEQTMAHSYHSFVLKIDKWKRARNEQTISRFERNNRKWLNAFDTDPRMNGISRNACDEENIDRPTDCYGNSSFEMNLDFDRTMDEDVQCIIQ